MRTPESYEREREEALDARIEAHIEAREQYEDEISDAREIEEYGYPSYPEAFDFTRYPLAPLAVLQTVWRRIKRPSRETIRRITQ